MSDHSGQSMTSYRSGWMSRWRKHGSKERAPNNNCSSSSFVSKESSHPSSQSPMASSKEVASSGCSPAKALEELKLGFSILKPESSKNTSTGMETRKLLFFPSGEGNSDRKDSQAAPRHTKDSIDFDTKLSLRCYVPPEADKNQPMECHSEAKGVSSKSSKETVAAKPRPFSMDLDVSSPDMLQLGLGQMRRPELDNSSSVGTGIMESRRNSKAPVFSGNKEELSLGPKQFQDTQRMMVIWKQSNKVCSSSQQMKNTLHVQENLRNSAVPLAALKLHSSQTTQSLLISTRAGIDSHTVGPPSNVRRVSAPARGCSMLARLSTMPPPPPPGSGSEWVKIHPIVDMGKRAIDDEKDDAAAEKVNMELDEFIQNTVIRGIPSPLSKMLNLTLPIPELTVGAPRACGPLALKPPVGNLALPSLPAPNKIGGTTSSRTESLGLETLLTHAEPLHQCKAEWCPGASSNPEPGTSWIKRLKVSASDKSGSKISSIEELLPHEKKVQNPERSEPAELHGVELVVLDENEKEASPEKASYPLALRPWMRRWCRVLSVADPQQKAPEKRKPICDPNAKLALPEIPEKQFPSIAAMALMGKAMTGFQPGEYKKKGSVTVWSDRGY